MYPHEVEQLIHEQKRLSRRDRAQIAEQLKRYETECGPCITMKVDPAVFQQKPVAQVMKDISMMNLLVQHQQGIPAHAQS